MKNISIFSENFHFLVVKFLVYLNRHVFVMFISPVFCCLGKAVLCDCSISWVSSLIFLYGPCHAKTRLRVYADSKGPDQPAHARNLIRTF